MTANTVYIKDIASTTDDKEIKDFFSFCGKITDIQVEQDGNAKKATVIFDKETAKKTALLLHNTQLGASKITVVSASGDTASSSPSDDEGATPSSPHVSREADDIAQEEKPRARILAEYLAHGYVIGDATLERALELDRKHGVSQRFVATLQRLDQKYHATDRARATDASYGITARGKNFLLGLGSYFEKATNTPTGQRIVQFYTDSSQQAQDIHAEARRLAELKKQAYGGSAYKASGLDRVFGSLEKSEKAETSQQQETPLNAAPDVAGVPVTEKVEATEKSEKA